MALHPLIGRGIGLTLLVFAAGGGIACGPDEVTGGVIPHCSLSPKNKDVTTVRCGDELAVDVWRAPHGDRGCYVVSGEKDSNPVIQCGDFEVTLNQTCVNGFHGDVTFGEVQPGESLLSSTAFSLSQCTVIHGRLSIVAYDGSPLGNTLESSTQPQISERVSAVTRPSMPQALRRLESVHGDMLLTGIEDVSLVDFPALVRVSGELRVEGTLSPQTISMPRLRVIGAGLWIDKNLSAQSIDLSSLERVGGDVRVAENDALIVFFLPKLHGLDGAVRVRDNCGLRDLSLPVLTKVKKYIRVHDNEVLETVHFNALQDVKQLLELTRMPRLKSLRMPVLASSGALEVEALTILQDLSLPTLAQVHGQTTLGTLPSLTTFAVPALTNIGGELSLAGLFGATELSFPALRSIGALRVEKSSGVERVVVPMLEEVAMDVVLHSNADLLSLAYDGQSIFEVGGNLTVTDNPLLREVGFHRLDTLEGGLWVDNNPTLDDVDVAATSVRGGIRIINNGITAIAFSQLTIAHDIEIRGNRELLVIAFPQLTGVEDSVSIRDNVKLNRGEIPRLSVLGGVLEVRDNPSLSDEVAYGYCDALVSKLGCLIFGN